MHLSAADFRRPERAAPATPVEERLPPHDVDAERCVIGSLLLSGGDPCVLAEVRGQVKAESFFQPDHAIYFTAICDLATSGQEVDGVLVRAELVRRGEWNDVGGTEYLAQILDAAPTAANAAHYAGIVREHFQWRELLRLANDVRRRALGGRKDVSSGAAALELAAAASALSRAGDAGKVHALSEIVAEVLADADGAAASRIPTGIAGLDDVIGGLRKGGKTIIGAKASMGKSCLLKQLALNMARDGVKVGVVAVEESRRKWGENLLSNASGVANNKIAFGRVIPGERQRVEQAGADISPLPIFVVDSARKLSEVSGAAHRLARQYGCEAVMVDHLHILDAELDENRERQVSAISAELKWVWKDLGVAGIEAAQLNRAGGRERPTLTSLRDSGSLEQDGDVVILLHREDYYERTNTARQPDEVLELIVAKNKDGASATVTTHFDESRQRITDFGPAGNDPFA